jgi:hypothetical protein
MNLDDVKQMNAEWQAWQVVVERFKQHNIDMNEPKYNQLIRAIELWGEELALLRRDQPLETVNRAHKQRVAQVA